VRRRRKEDRGLACTSRELDLEPELEQRASNKEPATGMAMLWVGAGCRCLRSC
jgi:hypothetical protein